MANEVWEEVKRYWRKVPSDQSDQGLELRRICRDYESKESGKEKREAILKTTEINSKENKEIQMKPEHKKKVNKVIKGLKKASKSHAAQAKTLQKVFRKGKTKR